MYIANLGVKPLIRNKIHHNHIIVLFTKAEYHKTYSKTNSRKTQNNGKEKMKKRKALQRVGCQQPNSAQ